ncbi:MAG: hypothetical protein U5L96_22080 [Owenweeksia sp.]|nr:hypothetical protein [Owenweeksia sp.]
MPSSAIDELVVGFDASFSNGVDNGGVDAVKKLNNNFTNFYTKINNDPYVFNGLNDQFTTTQRKFIFHKR